VAQLALDQGQDQGALVGEIAVHQPLADLGLGGDIADGTGMEAAGDEALLGGIEDAPALGLGMGGGGVISGWGYGGFRRHCVRSGRPEAG
jgi:hypothetical protein